MLLRALDTCSRITGSLVSWLLLLMMLTTCLVVLMRYLFQAGNIIFAQEFIRYLHAATFMLAVGWTLQRNGHVRVDIFYRGMSQTRQAWVNAIGTLLFLFPMAGLLLVVSGDFVSSSWAIRETSADAGGIPYVYILKSLIPAMCILLIMQGIAELIRNSLIICRPAADGSD